MLNVQFETFPRTLFGFVVSSEDGAWKHTVTFKSWHHLQRVAAEVNVSKRHIVFLRPFTQISRLVMCGFWFLGGFFWSFLFVCFFILFLFNLPFYLSCHEFGIIGLFRESCVLKPRSHAHTNTHAHEPLVENQPCAPRRVCAPHAARGGIRCTLPRFPSDRQLESQMRPWKAVDVHAMLKSSGNLSDCHISRPCAQACLSCDAIRHAMKFAFSPFTQAPP